MADSLVGDLEKVAIGGANDEDDCIDNILDQRRPRKRVKQDVDDLKSELEQKFLTPPTSFSTEWLNKLQQ